MAKQEGPIKNRPLPEETKIGGPDADLLRQARDRYSKAIDADRTDREEMIEDLRFAAGDQWPPSIKKEREEDSRPTLTINRMPQFIRQVTGEIRQSRMAIRVQPADDISDPAIAKVYTGLIRHIEYASDAQTAYVTAAEGAAQCGIGHFRIQTEYASEDTFEQDIRIRRIADHFAVTWDPHAIEPTKSDARYCFVEESVDRDMFLARYPNASTDGFDFQETGRGTFGDWFTHDTVRIAEYWTVEKEKSQIALLDDGRVVDMEEIEDQDGVLVEAETGIPIAVTRTRDVWRNRVRMRIISGNEVLEGPFEWAGRYIPVVPVIGEEIHLPRSVDLPRRYGVIRHARDAQRMYNFQRSAQTEKIALEPKTPWLVTVGNIKGLENIWKQANIRNLPYLPYIADAKNANAVPTRNAPQMGSSAIAEEVAVAAEDMKATTGIYDSGVGARGNETSGRAIRERKEQIGVSTIAYSDNLKRSLRHAGRILIDLLPKIYDNERVVRIMNEDETTELVRINQAVLGDDGQEHKVNDLTLGKYDVVMGTGPSYATKRAEAIDGIMGLVQAMPDTGALIADILVRNLDWPGAEEIADRLRKALPQGLAEPRPGDPPPQPQPPTPEEMMKAAELELKGRDADRKAVETAAKADKLHAEAEGARIEAAREALQMALENGAIESMIERQVEAVIARMAAPPPNGGM